jgi:hypothetical protein
MGSLTALTLSTDCLRIIKPRRKIRVKYSPIKCSLIAVCSTKEVKWAGNVARIVKMRNACSISRGKYLRAIQSR